MILFILCCLSLHITLVSGMKSLPECSLVSKSNGSKPLNSLSLTFDFVSPCRFFSKRPNRPDSSWHVQKPWRNGQDQLQSQYPRLRSRPLVQAVEASWDEAPGIHAGRQRISREGAQREHRREREQRQKQHFNRHRAQPRQQCSLLLRCSLPQCCISLLLSAKTSSQVQLG